MRPIPISEFQRDPARYLDEIGRAHAGLTISRPGHASVVIVPKAHWDRLNEALSILGNSADAAGLERSVAELDRGEGIEMVFDPGAGRMVAAHRKGSRG